MGGGAGKARQEVGVLKGQQGILDIKLMPNIF